MAKRLIDSAELIGKLPIVKEDKQISLIGAVADVVTMIAECKPVDAVEVVRCSQCKHWDVDPDTYGDGFGPEGICFGICDGAGKTKYDDFCSYGERKEKEG